MNARRFTRDPRPVALEGVRTSDVREVLRGYAGAGRRVIVADLTLGCWRVHEPASQLFAQLGLPEPNDGTAPLPPSAASRRSEIARRADAETSGDRVTVKALRLAGEALAALEGGPATIVCVLLPRHGERIERHDLLFVRFLAQALSSTAHRLTVVSGSAEAPRVPADWDVTWSISGGPASTRGGEPELALIPGVILPREADALSLLSDDVDETTLALPLGCRLVDPELRRAPDSVPRERYDRLAAAAQEVPWLAAYAQCHGTRPRAGFLWEQASRAFTAGASELALTLLERARGAARSPTHEGVVLLLAQAVRLSNRRFEEASAVPDPGTDVPPPLRGLLLYTKGWALTLSGRPAEAEERLAQARALMEGEGDSEEYLSLLNISALNRLHLGDWEGAFALEQRIRSVLDRAAGGLWHFRYINSLNLARLHRRRGDLDAAQRCFRDAFATTAGVRTESDALHANLSIARIEEERGRHANAFDAWLRVGLHWASSEAPEAIASRVTAVIALPGELDAHGNMCDATSASLLAHLRENAAAAGLRTQAARLESGSADEAPTFLKPEAAPPEVLTSAVWAPLLARGVAVLWSEAETPPALSSPAAARLRSALFGIVASGSHAGALRPAGTVLVDDRLGHELAATQTELAECCLRFGLRTQPPLPDLALANRRRVRLGSAVEGVERAGDSAVVTFKRYREPLVLFGPKREILDALLDEPTIAKLRARLAENGIDSADDLLRELERDRVVELSLPESVAALGC